jgi:hypothetical protein
MIFIVGLMSISLVSAVPPVTTIQSFTSGYIIEHAPNDYIELDKDYTVNFFLRNISNGARVTNISANCSFYLADDYGNLLVLAPVSFTTNNYWSVLIKGGNFSAAHPKVYPYGISCDGAGLGGEIVGAWESNTVGKSITTPQAILYLGFLILLILIFIVNFVGMSMLPEKNSRDGEGQLLSISYLKYFRNVLWMTGYFLFLGIVYIASNLAFAFLDETLMAKTLFMIFHIGLALAPVVVILWIIWMFVSMFHDKQMQKLLNRGMFEEGKL